MGTQTAGKDGHEVHFEYEPLADPEYRRVIELLPGDSHDIIQVKLHAGHPKQLPRYDAISYVWGKTESDYIICDGKRLLVHQSLIEALSHFRSPETSIFLWADAISINQRDDIEKSQQVKDMLQVYKDAAHVRIWLGADPDDEAPALFAGICALPIPPTHAIKELAQLPYDPSTGATTVIEHYVARQLDHLRRFAEFSWFDRCWVLQEVGASDSLTTAFFHWGLSSVDCMKIAKAMQGIQQRCGPGFASRTKMKHDPLRIASMLNFYPAQDWALGEDAQFYDLLHRCRKHSATDCRDHVFALLGHPLMRGLVDTGFAPDYTKTVAEVFIDVAERALMATQDLTVLCFAAHPPEHTFPCDVASWAPDWSSDHASRDVIIGRAAVKKGYSSSGTLTSYVRIPSQMPSSLVLQGTILETVNWASKPLYTDDLHPLLEKEPSSEERNLITDFWFESGCSEIDKSGGHPYDNFLRAFGYTLTALEFDERIRDSGLLPNDIAQHNKHFANYWSKLGIETPSFDLRKGWKPIPNNNALNQALINLWNAPWSDCMVFAFGASNHCVGRKFFRTSNGYLGLGPFALQPGDRICVLLGGRVPFAIRKCEDHWLLVGECHVCGLMQGQAIAMIDRREATLEAIELR